MPIQNEILKNKLGSGITPSAAGYSCLIGIIGLTLMLENVIMGGVLAFISFGIAGNRAGVIVNLKEQKYKQYSTFWFKKLGKWKSLKNYEYLSIKTNVEGFKIPISITLLGPKFFTKFYDVVLVHKNMTKTIVLSRSKSKESAKIQLKNLQDKTGKKYVSLNPQKNSVLKEKISTRRKR